MLCAKLVAKGTFIPLKARKGSFLARSDPKDVARVEERTFICTKDPHDAGPTNNWADPAEMRAKLDGLFTSCMRGRTLYVIPFSMGPIGSPYSITAIQITDSPYVAASMRIMTRIIPLESVSADFIPCLHSVGVPLTESAQDTPWPCRPDELYIAHFPEERAIISFGSGYGGNALLGKKALSLRLASAMGLRDGWLAEHMLILSITSPEKKKRYIAAAFPSACGKTNLAMLKSSLPGWTVACVGDDIAWIHLAKDGGLCAINPESGFFGVAPGTSWKSNPYAMEAISEETIFTNVALTPDGDVWWEGLTPDVPSGLIDWQGRPYTGDGHAAHPNSRFTVAAKRCRDIDPDWESPNGVPISAFIFGGRRGSVNPLVCEAKTWQQGVFYGASLRSKRTAAASGTVGALRFDPFAMLPFCGYNMSNYFAHWLAMGSKIAKEKQPRIYRVNWYRQDAEGKYIWPGFGENMRVLKWIFERAEGVAQAKECAIGWLPQDLDLTGLTINKKSMESILSEDRAGWLEEVSAIDSYFTATFGSDLPPALIAELTTLRSHLAAE